MSERTNSILSDTSLDFSLNSLQRIHFLLFDGISERAGKFRNKFNPRKKETVLQERSVKYANFTEIPLLLDKIILEEQKFNFPSLSSDEKIKHLSLFFSDLWRIHPFYDGNTRSVTLLMIIRMRKLDYKVNNTPFKNNAYYFRNCLVRSAYETRTISREFSFLESFLRNALNGVNMSDLSSELLVLEKPKLSFRRKSQLKQP